MKSVLPYHHIFKAHLKAGLFAAAYDVYNISVAFGATDSHSLPKAPPMNVSDI